ncbi:MAG: SEC-C domain-containing protein [Kineosporiaceae bacterium]|nr:SEC-C domain-containing protein [Kineosporiaceae bacterium]
MGKSARRATSSATAVFDPTLDPTEPVPVVGMREPCPCGSGKRYKACHGRAARFGATALVTRPFAGLSGECDWVALREIVPAATAMVRTVAEHGARDVTVSTVLPLAWPGLHRADGEIFVGLQTQTNSADAGRDVAYAILQALAAEPGTPVGEGAAPAGTPRLQEVLDPSVPFEVTVHDGFDFWMARDVELTTEARESIERANAAVVPTRRLASVSAAYWCAVGQRRHLRWVLPHDEDVLLDGVARLHAAGASAIMDGARYVGAFRSAGLVVPVWDLPEDAEAGDLEAPAEAFGARLAEAMADQAPLTALERGARAGVVSRQLTLR